MIMLIGFLFIFSQIISDVWTCKKSNETTILSHRKCFVVAENHLFSMINKPKVGKCDGFVCWDSHLTLFNKAKITWIYNSFRQQISISESINSMIKLNWHWTLENEALKIISECPNEKLEYHSNKRYIEGLDNLLTCEYNVAVHILPTTSQDKFIDSIAQFLRNNSMHDFDENHKFRRTSSLYFGCALSIVTVNSTQVKIYFTCVYCSKEESLANEYDKCVEYTTKSKNSLEFHNLCFAPKYVDLYGCEPKEICTPPTPDFWKKIFPGEMEQIYAIHTGEEIWLAINHTSIRTKNADQIRKENKLVLYVEVSENSWFFNYPSLPNLSFIYDQETTNELNILFEKTPTKNYLRPKRQTQKITNDQNNSSPYENYYPKCCLYLLILNLLLLIAILAVIYFTYRHYRKTHPKK